MKWFGFSASFGFAQGTRTKTYTARGPASLEDLDGRLLKGDETRHVEFR